jgi:predicted ATPase/DNA-binding CsgD family transcriptional regulator
VEVTPFVGRRRQLAEVKRLLSTSRLVTLIGIGGVGKTRLALRVAQDLRRGFRDGVCLVELADLSDTSLLGHTLAASLGLRGPAPDDQLDALVEYLTTRQLLLVLDNCEHVVEDCAVLLGRLLRSCPDLRVLATSRAPLATAGETVVHVPPLGLPESGRRLHPEGFAQYDALELLVNRGRAALSSFTVTQQNCADIVELCRGLEGIPLALELAAVRLRVLSPAEIVNRLDLRYGLLTGGDRAAPRRQQTLRASMDWSFDLCSPREQLLWMRLVVFSGGFELDAIEGVCSDSELLHREDILDVVASLVDKSVLIREEVGTQIRYRMLETIRQYGRERLETCGDLDAWLRRHRDWYADLVARAAAEWISPHQPRWLDRLRRERANLRGALEFCVTQEAEAPAGMRFAVALEHYWIATGALSEGRHWLSRAVAHTTGTDDERAAALRLYAWLGLLQNNFDDASQLLEAARRLVGQSQATRAYVAQTAGALAIFQGDLDVALGVLGLALEGFRSAGELNGEIHTLYLIGMALGLAGEADRAADMHRECLALTQARGEFDFRADSLWALGLGAWRQGDYEQALTLQCESLRLKQELDERLGIALCLDALAWLAATGPDTARAPRLLGAADSIWQTLGVPAVGMAFLANDRVRGEASVRACLSAQSFQDEHARGQKMSIEEAIALALGEELTVLSPTSEPSPAGPLTPREQEIAELVARGLTNKAVASHLVISTRTVEAHVQHILTKLGFTTRAQVAAWVTERRMDPGPR